MEADINDAQNLTADKCENSICPSKSTVYLGNISYSLTNNDLTQILEHCGKIVCTKIAKDKVTRRSKGYAFIQFLRPEDAHKCVEEYNGSDMFGRKWCCSIAKDNGRASEFIKKRTYPDKSRCYECGEFGHLSYKCGKNALGDREPPKKKKRKRSYHNSNEVKGESSSSGDESGSKDQVDSLSAAINYDRAKQEEDDYRERVASGSYILEEPEKIPKKLKFVKDEYFSDEEVLEDSH